MEKKKLESKDGGGIDVIKSMPITARVIYDEEMYLDWILELVSFK